jgi:aspartokinase-like uncharacterized kinase
VKPTVVKLGGSTAGAGRFRVENRLEGGRPIPPPLAPPHRGEGDFAAALPNKTVDDWRLADMQPSPPPPCGKGLGVGVSSSTIEPAREFDLWVAALAGSVMPLVVVPGGGPFADAVRETQHDMGFSDAAAHKMAILAMEQFAHIILDRNERFAPARSLQEIGAVLAQGKVPVWLPSALALSAPEIPQSWDVTSDSLAAWIAGRLGAETLLLIKQTDGFSASDDVASLSARGVVDSVLPSMLSENVALRLAGPRDAAIAAADFASGKLPGTLVALASGRLRRTA